jgi:hypothetical protein
VQGDRDDIRSSLADNAYLIRNSLVVDLYRSAPLVGQEISSIAYSLVVGIFDAGHQVSDMLRDLDWLLGAPSSRGDSRSFFWAFSHVLGVIGCLSVRDQLMEVTKRPLTLGFWLQVLGRIEKG